MRGENLLVRLALHERDAVNTIPSQPSP
jgi:hypothetical protein